MLLVVRESSWTSRAVQSNDERAIFIEEPLQERLANTVPVKDVRLVTSLVEDFPMLEMSAVPK